MPCKHEWHGDEHDHSHAKCDRCGDQITWEGLFCEASEVYADLKEEKIILKKDLAKACNLLNKANLYVDVCDDCTHHDPGEAWEDVNTLSDAIVEFLKAHEEAK